MAMQTRKNALQFTQNSGRNSGGEMTEINDAIFGTLTINPEYGDIVTQYQGIEYHLDSPEALENAHKIVSELMRYVAEAKSYAATNMLELKNETWTDEDDDGVKSLVTIEQFKGRMTLESISVSEDFTTFWFDDGQLFFGHVIGVDHNGKNWINTQIQG
jgi:hypothetical protein